MEQICDVVLGEHTRLGTIERLIVRVDYKLISQY